MSFTGSLIRFRWVAVVVVAITLIAFLSMVQSSALIAEEADSARDGDAVSAIDFARDIEPILNKHCFECHGTTEREGGLRFLTRRDLLILNDSGLAAVVPGKARESSLIRRVMADDELERMPPEGDPLSKHEIGLLTKWIDQDAKWKASGAVLKHWAYVPPKRAEVPDLKWPRVNGADSDVVTTPIDAFVMKRLKAEKLDLEPSSAASPAQLLRRVSLDLIGIPPSVEQVDAFLADPSPEHYQRIVDELLASPRYGEKWARQWLDLARYADSNGFQADQFRDIWAYRDWVITAMNDDMPFDEFTVAQVAGDLIPEAELGDRIATGFHRCTTCNVEAGVDPEENRTNQVIDRVNTTGLVWLGTSLECAQCHNHKYDPFSQQDYYQIFAFFNNTPIEVKQNSGVQFEVAGPTVELPLATELAKQRAKLLEQQAGLKNRIAVRETALAKSQERWEASLLKASKEAAKWHVLTPATFRSDGDIKHEVLEDQSILISGGRPDKETYTVTYETELTGITGFQIDALTDDTLPGKGPGRHSESNPNFVLNEFQVEMVPLKANENEEQATAQKVAFSSVSADYEQASYAAKNLIDGDLTTGWAIHSEFHKPHWAKLLTSEPIGFAAGTRFTITLPQLHGETRSIGRLQISALVGDPGEDSLPKNIRKLLAVDEKKRNANQKKQLVTHHQKSDSQLAELNADLAKLGKQLDKVKPETSMIMVEMEAPRMTHIFKRGNFLDHGIEVEASTPSILHSMPTTEVDAVPDRLAFANWLVSKENPLVARVTVNRWWAEFFGRGIVATQEDFGTQGDDPTHPELLDWLAVEFMEHDWSMKHVHRTIVLSQTYQQDSRITADANEADPANKYYARGPRFRMPAEMVRDNALAISGLLTNRLGGPPVYPPQPANIWRHVGRNAPKYKTNTDEDRFRRGVYVVWRRSAPYPSFINFDAPDRASCVVNRSRTNTPLQALTLLNDPAYVEMAHAFAKRVLSEPRDADDRQRIEHAFRLAVARTPTSEETSFLVDFLKAEQAYYEKDSGLATNLIPKEQQDKTIPISKQAAWFKVANILLNLDEVVTIN